MAGELRLLQVRLDDLEAEVGVLRAQLNKQEESTKGWHKYWGKIWYWCWEVRDIIGRFPLAWEGGQAEYDSKKNDQTPGMEV